MKHRRMPKRRTLLAGTGAVALTAAVILLPQANAARPSSPTAKSLTPAAAVILASALTFRRHRPRADLGRQR